ncbi:MAG: thiamine diphosphokinase [Candidatus Aenigmarchaeota archaeon]|nr:thiamine diphosphokinase [Candidatus Aenigmarchaeota archaeon]
MNIAILSSGRTEGRNFHKNILKGFDIIICADGGANNAELLGIKPNYIIGDMDSIKPEVMEKFEKESVKIIRDNNQGMTDTELAIRLALSLKPKKIILLGCIGNRFDHTIANTLSLDKIPDEIDAVIADDKNEIRLLKGGALNISGTKNDIISVMPLTEVKGLSYEGLKWAVNDRDFGFGWFGVSNRMTGNNAKISVDKGKILVIKSRD